MSNKIGFKLILLLVCMSFANVLAVVNPTTAQKSCVTEECHLDYSEKAFVHGPIGLGDCKSCHRSVDPKQHSYEFVRQGRDMCEYCHLDQTSGKNVHEPLKTGDCTQCHDPHSSDNKFLLVQENVDQLCQDCHQVDKGLKFLHGPVAVGQCTICHDSHSSDHDNLLVEESGELCFSCHVVTKEELEDYEYVHQPVKDDCVGCHSGHGGDNAKMLKGQSPELCYSCHEDIKGLAENAKHKHSPITEKDGCVHCHTPHASTVQSLLKQDPATLCMSCHDKPVGISKDEILPAFTDEIKDKKFLHGPVAQNDCKGCHISHGSEHFRLLSKKYPEKFYAPFSKDNYELCFGCHEETLVLDEKTDSLTDFRNGSQNLHFVHVNKAIRGRTCRSCHSTHASDLPKHIRKSVPYGKWELPIQFEKTETGGSCKPGCHLPYTYDRQSAVDYKKE